VSARGLQGAHSVASSQCKCNIASSAVQRAIAQPARLTRHLTRLMRPSGCGLWPQGCVPLQLQSVHVRRVRRVLTVCEHGFASSPHSHSHGASPPPVWAQFDLSSAHSHDCCCCDCCNCVQETGEDEDCATTRRRVPAPQVVCRQERSAHSHL